MALPWNATPRVCREHALKTLLAGEPLRAEQIRLMLRDEDREAVGEFAVYVLQTDALALRPWVSPPMYWTEDAERGDAPGDAEMRALVAKMRTLKVSVCHPDPLAAVRQAEVALAANQGSIGVSSLMR